MGVGIGISLGFSGQAPRGGDLLPPGLSTRQMVSR